MRSMRGTVLLYETEPHNREEIIELLQKEGVEVRTTDSIKEMMQLIPEIKPLGILISVYNETEYQEALELCSKFETWRNMPIVIMNRFSRDFQHTVDAISSGAYEHLLSHTSNAEGVAKFLNAVEFLRGSPRVQEPAGASVEQPVGFHEETQEPQAQPQVVQEDKREAPWITDAPPTGRLESVPVAELVEMFRNQIFDGKLLIQSPAGVAELEFKNGELATARTTEATELDAFYEISKWKTGNFWVIYDGKSMSKEQFQDLRQKGVPIPLASDTGFLSAPHAGILEEASPEDFSRILEESERRAETELEQAKPQKPEGPLFEEPQPEELESILAEAEQQAEAELEQAAPQKPEGPLFEEPQPEEIESILAEAEQQAEVELEQAAPQKPEGPLFEEPQPEELESILAEAEQKAEAELEQAKPQKPEGPLFEEPQPEEIESILAEAEQQAETELEQAAPQKPEGPLFEEPQPEEKEHEELEKLIRAADEAESRLKERAKEQPVAVPTPAQEEVWEEMPEDIKKAFRRIVAEIPTIRFACILDLFNNRWVHHKLEDQNPEEIRQTFVNILRSSEIALNGELNEVFGLSGKYSFMLFSFKDKKYYLGVKVVTADNPVGAIRLTVREVIKKLENIL